MEKRLGLFVFLFLAFGLILSMSVVSAQTYSGFSKFVDNVKLFFSSGDGKVKLALDIREKELNSAIENAKTGNNEEAISNLESAKNKLKIVREKISPDTAEEIKNNIDEAKSNINENVDMNKDSSSYFKEYLTEEEKTKLSVDLSEKVLNYCKELASQNQELMANDEKCKSYSWMEKTVGEKITTEKNQDIEKIKNQIGICMNNPKECNCDEISLASEKANCEKYKVAAIRCEFQSDDSACKEIDNLKNTGATEKETDRQTYEKEILEKYLPGECLEAGVKDGEECKKLIITMYQPESECTENGEYIGDEKCKEKLVNSENVVKECVVDGKLVDPKQCLNTIKEENKPTGKEWELMSGECKERGIYDPAACDEIVNLPRPCKDAGYYTKTECEAFTLNNNLPKECVDAGALTPEACEKLKLPSDCQGAYSREECETIKIEQKFPDECKSAGELDPEKCAVIMVGKESVVVTPGAEMEYLIRQGLTFEEIPSVCMNGKTFIRSMDCDAALAKLGITLPTPTDTGGIPKECMIDERTAVSPLECQNRIEKNIIINTIPKECQDAEVTNPGECGSLMEEKRIEQGIGINMPSKCLGISAEECKKIMEEKGIKVEKIEQVQKVEKVEKVQKMCKEGEVCEDSKEYEEVTIPEECIKLGISDYDTCKMSMSKINGERIKQGDKIIVDQQGNIGYLTGEQINKIVEESEANSQNIKPDTEKAEEIKQEIKVIDDAIKTIDLKKSDIDSGSNTVDNPSMDKKNDDVSPAPNIVNDSVNPGPQGIVGDGGGNTVVSDSSGSEGGGGGESTITGGAIGSSNSNNFIKKLFGWLFGR